MKTLKIACDHCDKDITYTGNCVDYRLSLAVEMMPPHPKSEFVTAMHIDRPMDQDKHFCGLSCLRNWIVEAENHPAKI